MFSLGFNPACMQVNVATKRVGDYIPPNPKNPFEGGGGKRQAEKWKMEADGKGKGKMRAQASNNGMRGFKKQAKVNTSGNQSGKASNKSKPDKFDTKATTAHKKPARKLSEDAIFQSVAHLAVPASNNRASIPTANASTPAGITKRAAQSHKLSLPTNPLGIPSSIKPVAAIRRQPVKKNSTKGSDNQLPISPPEASDNVAATPASSTSSNYLSTVSKAETAYRSTLGIKRKREVEEKEKGKEKGKETKRSKAERLEREDEDWMKRIRMEDEESDNEESDKEERETGQEGDDSGSDNGDNKRRNPSPRICYVPSANELIVFIRNHTQRHQVDGMVMVFDHYLLKFRRMMAIDNESREKKRGQLEAKWNKGSVEEIQRLKGYVSGDEELEWENFVKQRWIRAPLVSMENRSALRFKPQYNEASI